MNINDYIIEAFGEKSNEYLFDIQPELIDANNRFRIIKIDNIDYVVKRSTPDKADKESKNALIASKYLSDFTIDDVKINVVVPKIITIDENAYLVTPYLGQTLLGNLYINNHFHFDSNFLFRLVTGMFERGVIDRGCIPRNIILTENTINIIDWEDVVFKDAVNFSFNRLWETNFVLNWMYFFDKDSLIAYTRKLQPISKWKEPRLIKYEKALCNIIGWATDDILDVRDKIEELILCAEAPIECVCTDNFFPNDCAHTIADIFSTEIDAFFDIATFCCRKNEPTYFYSKIREIGFFIKSSLFVDRYCRAKIIYKILEIFCYSFNYEKNKELLEHYSTGNQITLEDHLYRLINKIQLYFGTTSPDYKKNNVVQQLIAQILLYSREFASQESELFKCIYKGTYFDVVRSYNEAPIRGSYHLIENSNDTNADDKIKEYAHLIKKIRDFLSENKIPMIGIYTQQTLEKSNTWLLPFHIPILKKMGIDPEIYQPHIPFYVMNYPRDVENEDECIIFDEALTNWLK